MKRALAGAVYVMLLLPGALLYGATQVVGTPNIEFAMNYLGRIARHDS